jgi:hypothetical protein
MPVHPSPLESGEHPLAVKHLQPLQPHEPLQHVLEYQIEEVLDYQYHDPAVVTVESQVLYLKEVVLT